MKHKLEHTLNHERSNTSNMLPLRNSTCINSTSSEMLLCEDITLTTEEPEKEKK